jgi:hypothetical protein
MYVLKEWYRDCHDLSASNHYAPPPTPFLSLLTSFLFVMPLCENKDGCQVDALCYVPQYFWCRDQDVAPSAALAQRPPLSR